jgi:pSer/pThr/pTyr-binding forkhead associated (FHA) protein
MRSALHFLVDQRGFGARIDQAGAAPCPLWHLMAPKQEEGNMNAKVTLTLAEAGHSPKEFVFEQPSRSTVGRADDCDIWLPGKEHHVISRHHCEFDISPPEVRIRDLGSRNGTFVNGERIQSIAAEQTNEHTLKDGDEVRVGNAVLRIVTAIS